MVPIQLSEISVKYTFYMSVTKYLSAHRQFKCNE